MYICVCMCVMRICDTRQVTDMHDRKVTAARTISAIICVCVYAYANECICPVFHTGNRYIHVWGFGFYTCMLVMVKIHTCMMGGAADTYMYEGGVSIHTCMHACKHTEKHAHARTYTYTCAHTFVYTYILAKYKHHCDHLRSDGSFGDTIRPRKKNCTLVGHELLMCSKLCFTKSKWVQWWESMVQ